MSRDAEPAGRPVDPRSAAGPGRPRLRSLDAWVMSNPSGAFRYMASQPPGHGVWPAVRRPLFVACVLGCAVSLVASGTLTVRIAASATAYWAFVPLVELLALAAVIWRRRRHTSLPTSIDTFFAGHGPWTLYLIVLAGTLASVPPQLGWKVLTTVALWALALVMGWSAYIDFHFFRCVVGASRAVAVRDVVVHRLLTWTAIVWIFAIPVMTPWAITEELAEAMEEVLRR